MEENMKEYQEVSLLEVIFGVHWKRTIMFIMNITLKFMHNMKRRVLGSLMAVLMGASTVASTCPAPIFAADTNVQENTVDADIVASGENYGLTSVT